MILPSHWLLGVRQNSRPKGGPAGVAPWAGVSALHQLCTSGYNWGAAVACWGEDIKLGLEGAGGGSASLGGRPQPYSHAVPGLLCS